MEYLLFGVLLLFIVTALLTMHTKIQELENKVKWMNGVIDQVTDQLGLPEHPINDRLRKLLIEGKFVQAVKEARLAMGLSLLDAKKYIDKLKEE